MIKNVNVLNKNENGFEIDSIVQTNPNDSSNFNVAKKTLK